MKKNISSLLRYSAPFKRSIIVGIILAILSSVLKMITPDNIRKIMDYLQENINGTIDLNVVLYFSVTAGLFMIGSFILNSVQSVILSTVAQKLAYNLKKMVNEKIDRLPVNYFIMHPAGDTQSRLTNDVDAVATALSNNAASLMSALATLVVCLFMMFKTNVILSVVTLLNSFLGLVITIIITKKAKPYAVQQQVLLGAVNSEVYEYFSGHLVIKAFNCEDEVIDHFRDTNRKLTESGWKASFFQSITLPLMMLISNMGYIFVAITGTILMLGNIGNTTIGDVLVFILYSNQVSNPLKSLASAGASFQPAMVATERIDEIMDEKEIADPDNPTVPETVKGNVRFDHVKFGYLPDQIVLNDLCAEVRAGQKIAIVGPTGAGKSTMVNLLMRFYEPQGGRILLDGIPLNEYSEETLHSMLGMVLQDTWTFEGTIRENIVYSNKDISEERLSGIIDDIGLRHFIDTLPQGVDTVLSESAAVSAGQKQLITIGRAMAKNAPVLILDEATSSVDTRTEKLIQSALDKLTEGRTSFVIAHRLSTIKNADCIFVMKDGDVVEIGKHDELLARNGLYAELYNSQFGGN